ncbi:BRO family protein [Leucobacter sp. M11]|uniref:BRO family protein n=1 Tax=Leucobacter sp. M11 TaxID=2993565 RepID=UPI002D800139|nr:BRO family protein [Leucobacter sp. M11]MEB4614039.1 BRO family protein [Leucobacter sp. M11]
MLEQFIYEGQQVRTVTLDGDVWFVARDVAVVLGYSEPGNAIRQHCRGGADHTPIVDSLGRTQQARVINEADVLRLIVRSQLPAAEQFERWVFEEVLPQIRKTGSYSAPKTLAERSLELIGDLNSEVLKLTAKVEQDAPKVDYVDTYVSDSDLRLFRNVAKSLGMTEGELRTDLVARKWVYVEHVTRWSETKQAKEPIARYSAYSHKAAYFDPVPNHTAPRFKGEVMHTLKITPAGAVAIARLYGKHLQLVEVGA